MIKDKRTSVFFDRETNKFRGIDSQILKQLPQQEQATVAQDMQLAQQLGGNDVNQ